MPKKAISEIWTAKELTKALGVTKQQISNIARVQGWQHVSGYTGDIVEYLWSIWRMKLARQMGIIVQGAVEHDEWDKDDNCPVCGGFAIWKPATDDEISNLEINIYNDGWPWLCVNGHSDKGDQDE